VEISVCPWGRQHTLLLFLSISRKSQTDRLRYQQPPEQPPAHVGDAIGYIDYLYVVDSMVPGGGRNPTGRSPADFSPPTRTGKFSAFFV
jgi:hypothetical protein